jgi:hypothetical protein
MLARLILVFIQRQPMITLMVRIILPIVSSTSMPLNPFLAPAGNPKRVEN